MRARPNPNLPNPSAAEQANSNTYQLALFAAEDMPLSVVWPCGCDEVEVLRCLLSGERITQPKYGFDDWRLGARIKALKYKGFPIESLRINHQRSKYPYQRSKIAEYFITADNLFAIRQLMPSALHEKFGGGSYG